MIKKILAIFLMLHLTNVLGAEEGVPFTYNIVPEELNFNDSYLGFGTGFDSYSQAADSQNPGFSFLFPFGFASELDILGPLSLDLDSSVSVFYFAPTKDDNTGDGFSFLHDLNVELYLKVKFMDATNSIERSIILKEKLVGTYGSYDKYEVTSAKFLIPTRQVLSLKLGKEMNLTWEGISLDPLAKLYAGLEYESLSRSVIETDKFGKIRVEDYFCLGASIFYTGVVSDNFFESFGLRTVLDRKMENDFVWNIACSYYNARNSLNEIYPMFRFTSQFRFPIHLWKN